MSIKQFTLSHRQLCSALILKAISILTITLLCVLSAKAQVPNRPGNVTGPSQVQQGTSATYRVTASSNATSYRWSVNPSNAGTVSGGSTSAVVTWSATYLGFAGVQCTASNSSGSTDALGASVTIIKAESPLFLGSISPFSHTINSGTDGGTLSASPASGGNGTYSYQWQRSPDNSSWVNIDGATGLSCNAGRLDVTTYFRLVVTSGTQSTNSTATINVYTPLAGGAINPAFSNINYNGSVTLTAQPATGGSGSYTYQWTTSTDGINFTPIFNATGLVYQTPSLTVYTFYRLISTNNSEQAISSAYVTVYPQLASGTASGNQTINYGASTTLTASAATGGNGTYTYQWQVLNGGNWTNAPSTALSLSTGALTANTSYRLISSSAGVDVISNTVIVSLYPQLAAGAITPLFQNAFYNTASQIKSDAPTGGNGVYQYQWLISENNTGFVNVDGAVGLTLQTKLLTSSASYRLMITSNGVTISSNTATVNVFSPFTGGSIDPSNSVINYDSTVKFTSSPPTGGGGDYTYQWTSGTDGINFTPILNAINLSYETEPLKVSTYYRLVYKTGSLTTVSSAYVKVYPQLIAGAGASNQTINYGGSTILTGIEATGGNGVYSYQWQILSGSTWNNVPASGLSFSTGALTASTSYRLISTSASVNVISTTVTVSLYPQLAAGAITPLFQNAFYNTASQITSNPATGGNGVYSYQWLISENNAPFVNVDGAVGLTLQTKQLIASASYRLMITSNGVTISSNTATVNVFTPFTGGTIDPANPLIGYNDKVVFTSSLPTGGGGNYTYQWTSATDGMTFTPILNATDLIYDTGPLKLSTYYRLVYKTGSLTTISSAYVTVYPQLVSGIVTGNQTTGYGTIPIVPIKSESPTGGSGTYSYQWQAFDGSNWTDVPLATDLTFPATALTLTTSYRLITKSSTLTVTSNSIVVTVDPKLTAGILSPSSLTVAQSATVPQLIVGPASGGSGTYDYQWETSLDGTSWTSISVSGLTYTPAGLTVTTYYRNAVKSNQVTAYSNVCKITVSAATACAPLITAPTTAQNYIMTSVVKIPGYIPGGAGYSVCDVMQTIQYMDGIGRPLQTVQVKGSPAKSDLVQPFAYDAYGRESVKYLPFASPNTSNGSYKAGALGTGGNSQSAFYKIPQASSGITPISTPYAVTVFEPSPLNRVLEQGAPGDSWQPTGTTGLAATPGHTVRLSYATNNTVAFSDTSGTRAVILYTANTSDGHVRSLSGGSDYYDAGQLSVTITRDENQALTGRGGTVEEYKDKEGHVVLKRLFNYTGSPMALQMLSTYYVYDHFGNLTYVLPPGANPDAGNIDQAALDKWCYQYGYDQRQRMVEKQVPGKGLEYFVYNKLDQVVVTQDANQHNKQGQDGIFTRYDALGRVIVTGTYHADGIPGGTYAIPTYIYLFDNQAYLWEERADTPIGYTSRTLPDGESLISNYLTINYYDDYNFPGGATYPYSTGSKNTRGLLTGTKTLVLGTNDMLLNVNYYDDKGRLSKVYKQHYQSGVIDPLNYDEISYAYNFENIQTSNVRVHHNSASENTVIAMRYEYDHMNRKLKTSEKINNDAEVLLSSSSYNEIGQLKGKALDNNLQNTSYSYNERGWLKKSISDQFSQQLNYQEGSNPQYNGNISGQLWGAGTSLSSNFVYVYDKLNRLNSGIGTGMSETISYDVMGNIQSLNRDGLVRNYDYNGNQLNKTTGGPETGTYQYDYNGNTVVDGRNGQAVIYNYLNLPSAVPGLGLSYVYDAEGEKLKKISGSNTTDYISGIQYTNGAIDIIQTEEGLARRNAGSYSYEYNLKDHLGNVRYSFHNIPATGQIERIQSDDYYPFGLRKSSGSTVSLINKYLYNGKEIQDELGDYDYGARFYDPVIGKWNVVDPSAENYYSSNPYNYVDNDPISKIDPDGRNSQDSRILPLASTHTDERGKVLAVFDDGDLGIYKHSGATSFGDILAGGYSSSNTSGGGTYMGQTLMWNSFTAFDQGGGATGQINFGSYEARNWLNNFSNEMEENVNETDDYLARMWYALHGGGHDRYDFKTLNDRGLYRGSQISKGVYVSARDVGNFAAGRAAKLTNQDKMEFMLLAGGFQQAHNSKLAIMMLGTGYWMHKAQKLGYPSWGEASESNYFQRLGYENIRTPADMKKKLNKIWDRK